MVAGGAPTGPGNGRRRPRPLVAPGREHTTTHVAGLPAFLEYEPRSFAFFQFGSRIFLGAEYAIGITMVVEEFPAARRGRALGTLLTCNALGTIVVGLLLGAKVQDGPLEWRTFYLVGLLPLVVLSL